MAARPFVHVTGTYIAFFLMMGAQLPFWPLWLGDWGLSASEVGMFGAIAVAARIVAGVLVPALADRLDARRATAVICALVSIGLYVAHVWIGTKVVLLAATIAVGIAMAGIHPIVETLSLAAARSCGFSYARARGLGSLGFLAASLVVGALIAQAGSDLALWWIVGWLAVVVLLLPRHSGGGRVEGQVPPEPREIAAVILDPVFRLFLATVAFIQGSHCVLYALGSVHWRALGLGEGRIGALWAGSVALEVLFMVTIGGWTVARLGPARALGLSALAGIVRWGAMATDPVGWALVPLQALHSLTFALGHLAAMAFIARAVPQRFGAAAQGAMGPMAVGSVMALGMAAASGLYPWLGGATYALGAVFCAVSAGLSLMLMRAWRGGRLGV